MDEPDPAATAPVGPAGQILAGRYELLGLLGVGGMGAVYRARDLELDEIVALKMLRDDMVAAPGMLTRFRQEAKLARKVTHKNVARTFDIGEHDGAKFLTMEYVDGESLKAVLAREKRLPLTRVVELVEAICAGLGAAHAAGVVHRDLKPDNVLVAKDGRVVITDFGIARGVANDQTIGGAVGTPTYMAPEQVEGAPNVDARADLYALGAMTYELLTGKPPWDGDSAISVATRRLTSPPPDPRAVIGDIPDLIAGVVLRCMARRPDDRFATASEVASAFAGITLPAPSISVPSARSSVRSLPAAFKAVAVLPFRNAGSPEDEYLADGLTEDLIDTLSMNQKLRVRSRGSVIRYKGVARDPQEIGRELDVHVVADGSVRRIGEQLRIAVKLVGVDDGFQLWAKRYDRPAADVLAVADEAAAAIASALTIDWRAPARVAPTNPVALDLFLRARHEYSKRGRNAGEVAVPLFQQALAHAPRDPTILSHYAMALARTYAFGRGDEGASFAREARAIAEQAIAEAPELGAPRLALATIELFTGDPVAAMRETEKALAFAPMLPEVHELYARLLIEIGHADRGITHLRTAIQLEPRFEQLSYEMARALALRGDWTEANAILATPPADNQLLDPYWIARARLVMWRRDVAEATACMTALDAERFVMREPVRDIFGVVLTKTLSDAARARFDQLREGARTQRRRSFFCQVEAEGFACANDVAGTLRALEDSASADLFDIFWLDRCPVFDFVRSEPRFAAVRERVTKRAADLAAVLSPRD